MAAAPAQHIINPAQLGGIEHYTLNDGAGRGVRALCINTGAGLLYRVLVDRGLDIDQAFFNQHSLSFLTHRNPTAPTRGHDQGLDWLKSFGAGLLTSCGPFSIGAPASDNGESLGLHGTHTNTPASLDAVFQPNLESPDPVMTIIGRIRYGGLYGPNVELTRTIRSWLGQNRISFEDQFHNHGNTDAPHAWLLHINFGYPLLDAGAQLCVDAKRIDGVDDLSTKFFQGNWKRITPPRNDRRGPTSTVAYIYPRAARDGRITAGIVNPKLSLGLAIHYNQNDFPRLVNWQHLAPREYVAALEPSNGGVEGRDKDRARGWLDNLLAGQSKTYRYELEILTTKQSLIQLTDLNR